MTSIQDDNVSSRYFITSRIEIFKDKSIVHMWFSNAIGSASGMQRECDAPAKHSIERLGRSIINGKKKHKKNKNNKKTTENQANVTFKLLDKNGEIINTNDQRITNAMAFYTMGRKLVLSTGITYDIVCDNPEIIDLHVWGNPIEGCPLAPAIECRNVASIDEICEWQWYRLFPGSESILVGKTRVYTPTKDDVGCLLRVFCSLQCEYSTSSSFTLADLTLALPERRIIDERVSEFTQITDDNGIRVLSYNILADAYSHTWDTMYPYCEPQHREIWYRLSLLAKEILEYKPDIICLQEVDSHSIARFWTPQFHGVFDGFFTEKTGKTQEGIGMFWRSSKIQCVHKESISFKDYIKSNLQSRRYTWLRELLDSIPEVARCIPKVTTVAQVCKLQLREKQLIMANTHLFYHPVAGNIRCIQLKILTNMIEDFMSQAPKGTGAILCGDLNAQSFDLPMEFLLKGQVAPDHQDWATGSTFRWGSAVNFARLQNDNQEAPSMILTQSNNNTKLTIGPYEVESARLAALVDQAHTSTEISNILETYFEVQRIHDNSGDPRFEPLLTKIEQALVRFRQDCIEKQNQCTRDAGSGLEENTAVGLGAFLTHSLNFISACGYPQFTNYVQSFSGDLDWIVISEPALKVIKSVTFPSESVMELCPSERFPSDHISLCCDVAWKS